MGKPGKKAGAGILPPTNVKRRTDATKSHLRDSRTIKRLKMYTSKIQRDEKGNIIKGSVLGAADRVEKQMARIAPDRRWFGNTRVIGQEALQDFRKEMGEKYKDPYSVIIKQGKLPLSLLEEPKGTAADGSIKREMQYADTFGDKSRRKRVRLPSMNITDMVEKAKTKDQEYSEKKHSKDRSRVNRGDPTQMAADKSMNRILYKKGQSNRIWNELYKVVDSADVILYVVDARDPVGTRSAFLEEYMKTEKKYKHFVFVLNKCDLVPLWVTARWLQILSKDFPTIAFHASVNHPFGKGNLISLLRQFNKLHNVTHRGNSRTKTPISVGIVGYPNVGKSSLINTLRRKSVCKVAPIPGETKCWQYVALTRSIFLIDCPGVVYDKEGNNDVQAVLKGVVRVERLGSEDKTEVVSTVLQIVKHKDITGTYGIREWRDVNDFLEQLATNRGKLVQGGKPDVESVARSVLYDWQRGKIPWFNAPPFESNQQYRECKDLPQAEHMKNIEHYSTFNVVDDQIAHGDNAEDADDEEEEEESESVGAENNEEGEADEAEKEEETNKKANSATKSRNSAGDKKEHAKTSKKKRGGKGNDDATVATYMEEMEAEKKKKEREERRAQKRGETGRALKKAKKESVDADDALWEQFLETAK